MGRICWILVLSTAVLGLGACAKDRAAAYNLPVAPVVLPALDAADHVAPTPVLEEPVDFAGLSDEAVGQRVYDPRAQVEISRRFQQTRPLRLVVSEGQLALQGADDFARRQQLFLLLMDVFFLRHDQLTGASRDQVEAVFGPGAPDPTAGSMTDRYIWDAGRDLLVVEYQNHRVVFAAFLSE